MAVASGINVGQDARRMFAPSADRNKEPILKVLKKHLPSKGAVLEVASGTGQHSAYFSSNLSPNLTWQPTETAGNPGPTAPPQQVQAILESISSYTEDLPNVLPPIELDASLDDWNVGPTPPHEFVGVLAVNVTHISPFVVTEGLLKGAGKLLSPGGRLLIYGPFKVGGEITPESNVKFDQTLRSQNPEWGLRDIEHIEELAKCHGLTKVELQDMPANNWMIIFQKND
mmetsp:Transcript_27394/g.51804  ORF Transcript_27394/g.51804 Transcript_27394/m.51804 type:complete len:228 (+) Transcript_27394:81-764(+)